MGLFPKTRRFSIYDFLSNIGVYISDKLNILIGSKIEPTNSAKVYLKAGNADQPNAFLWHSDRNAAEPELSYAYLMEHQDYGMFAVNCADVSGIFGGRIALSMNPSNGLIFSSPYCSWVISDTSFFVNHDNKFHLKINDADRLIIDNNNVILSGLPTSDPLVANALWNDAGVLKVSSG